MSQHNQQDDGLTTQRIEAFSDGVFAIAITLLILDIRMPTGHTITDQSLVEKLWSIWPSYFAYILSFIVIGIYWVNHHYIFQIYEKTNHIFNLLNVFFLMCISFLPFPTYILGTNLLNEGEERTTIAFYIFGLLLPAIAWFICWQYACSHNLINPNLSPTFISYISKQYILTIILYSIALLSTLVQPLLGLIISVGLTFSYIRPQKQPTYIDPTKEIK